MNASNAESKEEADAAAPHLYFVIDTTGSMSSYIASLNVVLEQILRMVRILFAGNVRLHIIGYKDYCDSEVIAECHDNASIPQWVAKNLRASGGGDAPEAAKTALNVLYEHIVGHDAARGRNSFVFVYTDAAPHHPHIGSTNIAKERAAIERKFQSPSPGFDWVAICRSFSSLGVPFFIFLSRGISTSTRSFWQMLGSVVLLPSTQSDHITKATIGVLSQLMGADDEHFVEKYAADYKLSRYGAGMAAADALDFDAMRNETQCGGLLPPFKGTMAAVDFMQLTPLRFLSSVLGDLPKKLLSDESFRDLVFAEFAHIFTAQNIQCLCYNAVFGSIWRRLCRFREDDRLKLLRDTFSVLVTKMDDAKRLEMQQWIDCSYDDTEEINRVIREHLESDAATDDDAKDGDIEFISLDAIDAIPREELPTKKELLTIANSLFGDIVRKMQNIMTHLVVLRQRAAAPAPFEEAIASYSAIPSRLGDRALFSLLSHLVIPGTMFTLRPSLVLAMIAVLSGNAVLKERAESLLRSVKGRWIAVEKFDVFPEFLSVPFVKLVTRCDRAMDGGVLTDSERTLYDRLHRVYRVRSARPKEFEVEIGFVPKVAESRPDFKRKCIDCGHWRSFTLMTEGDRCGRCRLSDPVMADHEDLGDVEKRSHLVSCFGCAAIYGVTDVKGLNVRPKCHFCREMVAVGEAPAIECSQCLNRWVLPNAAFFGAGGAVDWRCPCCTESGHKVVDSVRVSFEALCSRFPVLLDGLFDIDSDRERATKDLFSTMSLFKLYMKHKEALFPEGDEKEDTESLHHREELQRAKVQRVTAALSRATFDGRRIHRIGALVEAVATTVSSGKLADICCLCFEAKALTALESACGRCRNVMCFECLAKWYQQLRPGQIVLPSHLLCPFCKQRPLRKTLKKYNKDILAITRCEVALSTAWYHGWCVGCYRVQQAVPRQCLRERTPTLTAFRCEECTMAQQAEAERDDVFVKKTFKKCPGCEAHTVKSSGCNHITCRCGVHWCYQCGEQHPADSIYDHMDEAHGGINL